MERRIRVLYIDDSPLDRDLVRDALEKEDTGFQVIQAASRAEFNARLTEGGFDVVLSDFNILGFDGLDVLDAVCYACPDTPVIIVTGTGSEEIAVEALKRGADDYVIKTPKHIRRLPPVIRAALEKRHLNEERARSQKLLQESEERWRLLVQYAPDTVTLVDRDAKILFINRVPPGVSMEAVVGSRLYDFMTPENRAIAENALAKMFASGEPQKYQVVATRADAQVRWYDNHVGLLRQGAAIENAIIVTTDVTEHKQMEDSLQASEQSFRYLFAHNPHPMWVYELATLAFLEVNDAAVRKYGYSRDEFLNMRISDIRPAEDVPRLLEYVQQSRPAIQTSSGWRHRLKDGTLIDVEVVSHKLEFAGRTAVLVVAHDVTERKRAQEKLAASEAELRALFAAMRDVVMIIDREGIYRKIAPTNPELLYRPPEELLGKSLRDVFPAAQAERFLTKTRQVLATQQIEQIEYELQIGDQHYWFATSITPLNEESTVWVARDITERKQRERELQAIATVSAALRVARTRAEMLPILLDQLMILLNAVGATFEMFDATSGETAVELGVGIWNSVIGNRIPPGAGLTAHVLATRKPYVTNDAPNDARLFRPDLLGACTAVAGVPLIAQDQLIGLIWIARTTAIGDSVMRLFNAIADIAANAIHRATLHEQTQRQVEQLDALHTIDQAIGSTFDLRFTLDVILEHTLAQLQVDAASILLLNPQSNMLEYAAARGFRPIRAIEQTRLRVGESFAGRVAQERQVVHIPNLPQRINEFIVTALAGEGFAEYYGVPLIAKDHIVGVLQIFHRAALPRDPEWRDFCATLAGQAAIAIDNTRLFRDLQQSNMELVAAYDATIEGWSHALDLRDRETEGHTLRVVDLTLRLAQAMGVSDAELVHIRRGALLHDIGKMGVPDAILLKPGALTDDEWKIMRKHPEYAFQLLSPITYLRSALDIPYSHHERWDGTGYPRRLKGEEIPLVGRIFAVVDVWDAMSSDRPYRKGLSKAQVHEHIRAQAGTHFDPKVVEVFLAMTE